MANAYTISKVNLKMKVGFAQKVIVLLHGQQKEIQLFISLFKRLKPPSLRRTDLSPMARDDIMFEKRVISLSEIMRRIKG